MDVKKLLNSW